MYISYLIIHTETYYSLKDICLCFDLNYKFIKNKFSSKCLKVKFANKQKYTLFANNTILEEILSNCNNNKLYSFYRQSVRNCFNEGSQHKKGYIYLDV